MRSVGFSWCSACSVYNLSIYCMIFQDSIQRILLDLAVDLTREHRLHEKRRVLLMYCLFCGQSIYLIIIHVFQDSIQRIMLDLAVDLTREHRLHEKRRVLLMYCLFCKMLLKEFHKQLGGSWAYVLREIIYRLIYVVKDMVHRDR